MLLDTLVDKAPAWTSGDAPEGCTVVLAQCTAARNLSDFPFPGRCTPEEKRQVMERVMAALDSLSLLGAGRFYDLEEMEPREQRFLAERRAITSELLRAEGPRGVYVSEDQSLSIMVNGADHLCIRAIFAGARIDEAWARVNLIDDTLAGLLDYAHDERLGYLTTALAHLGAGLKGGILLHLPCAALADELGGVKRTAAAQRLSLHGVKPGADDPRLLRKLAREGGARRKDTLLKECFYGDMSGAVCGQLNESAGDLFLLTNDCTLGVSEEEIVFHLRHTAAEIAGVESGARDRLREISPRGVEDRVGRALGIAGGARLLGFAEAMGLLSSIRLGIAAGIPHKAGLGVVNALLLGAQRAHVEAAAGRPLDELTLSAERADLFRNQFGSA